MRRRGRTHAAEPVSLRDAVAAVGHELGMPPPDVLDSVHAAWAEIVGDAFVAHSSVRSVRDGVCTIVVDDGAWATQLRYAEQTVLERLGERCGAGVVTTLRIVVARGLTPGS